MLEFLHHDKIIEWRAYKTMQNTFIAELENKIACSMHGKSFIKLKQENTIQRTDHI